MKKNFNKSRLALSLLLSACMTVTPCFSAAVPSAITAYADEDGAVAESTIKPYEGFGPTTPQSEIDAVEQAKKDKAAAQEASFKEQAAAIQANAAAADEKIDTWYDGTTFVGDSLMIGFRGYAMKNSDTWLGKLNFICAGSFSVYSALTNSLQPMLFGQKTTVWDGLKQLSSKRVFICLGLNDINIDTLEHNAAAYKQFVEKIIQNNPGIDVNIISMTYTYPGINTGNLNNATIREYNSMLQNMAAQNGWGYVDLADALADSNGDLTPEFCTDNYVHMNDHAYSIWASVFRNYASRKMGLAATSASASEGGWVSYGNTWKYVTTSGRYYNDGWHWIDSDGDGYAECYYFTADGTLLKNSKTPDGYTVNASGAWTENGKIKTTKNG